MNRMGDLLFLIFFGIMYLEMNLLDPLTFIFMTAMWTKSAMYPFSVWLVWAMLAPTPVSALVHSSTLVTAGIMIFIMHEYFFWFNFSCMLAFGVVTVLIASLLAFSEMDAKKMVAYSTISQMGILFCMVSLVGGGSLSLNYLLYHGFVKSSMFILVGYIIMHLFSQSLLKASNVATFNTCLVMILIWIVFGLAGTLNVNLYFAKHSFGEKVSMMDASVCSLIFSVLLMNATFAYVLKMILGFFIPHKYAPLTKNFKFSMSYLFGFFFMFGYAIVMYESMSYPLDWNLHLGLGVFFLKLWLLVSGFVLFMMLSFRLVTRMAVTVINMIWTYFTLFNNFFAYLLNHGMFCIWALSLIDSKYFNYTSIYMFGTTTSIVSKKSFAISNLSMLSSMILLPILLVSLSMF